MDNIFATYKQVEPPEYVSYNQIGVNQATFETPKINNTLDTLIQKVKQQFENTESLNNVEPPSDESNPEINPIEQKNKSPEQKPINQPLQTEQVVVKNKLKGKKAISDIMDKLGIQGEKKATLLKIAKIESSYNSKSEAKGSSACGLFGFINSTRRQFSKLSRDQFLNDPEEQVRCASQLYEYQKQFLRNKGFNPSAEAIALAWFSPKWALTYLRTGRDDGQDVFGTTPSKYLKKFREA